MDRQTGHRYNHIVGAFGDRIRRLLGRTPRALCGYDLAHYPGEPDTPENAPLCPECEQAS